MDSTSPATTVTEARSVTPARSVTEPSTTASAPSATIETSDASPTFIERSRTATVRTTLPADHPQVLAASAPPPPREAYQRAPLDQAAKAEIVNRERSERELARTKQQSSK